MPCTFKTNIDANLVVKRYTGRITTRCILELLDSIELDPNYVEGMHELDDMREVTELVISLEEVSHFAELIKGYGVRARGLTRKAVVAHAKDIKIAFGYFKSLVADAGLDVGIFETLEEALDFLNVSAMLDRDALLPPRVFVH